MSGHSKWANIKNKKGAADAKRANVFTKIGREIAVAVKAGGPDPNTNSKLANVIAKAKAANMPNDNIERGIKKASGALDSVNYEENVYEGYAPGGVAVIVKTLTDNKNRTASEIRHHFDKCGGNLGTTGCVSYMFESKGVIVVETALPEDDLMMLALEAGADDVTADGDVYEIYTAPSDLDTVRKALEGEKDVKILSAEQDMIPSNTVKLDEETERKVQRLLDMLDENDDVQDVYHNAELTEEEEED
ncbi:MAG TPA: YebC/PmpR family DNA-binding transcriptional regulator [Candidatus Ornithoclostridium excrementipullorum]|nr:YebC/PmpR family DNA-binding transcriptional regulator [Candidatus Ornithoclostridium excrementipullorum]